MHVVRRSDFEARIEQLRNETRDPVAGIFGPSSKLWEVNRYTILFLAGGRALLLQSAHPYVAHGVEQHSVSLHDPIGRFQRTFAAVFAMVYGDLETAITAARRTHEIHTRIAGHIDETIGGLAAPHAYAANDAEALFWVHATLWDSSVRIFETFVRPLGDAEKEQYYDETRRFAWLFGIPDAVIPDGWREFEAYNEAMAAGPVLDVGRPAGDICRSLFHPPNGRFRRVMRWYQGIVAGQLPPRLREAYGLSLDPHRYERSIRRIRAVENRLPRRLRHLPAYIDGMRRIEGRTAPDPLGRLLGRAFVGPSGANRARSQDERASTRSR